MKWTAICFNVIFIAVILYGVATNWATVKGYDFILIPAILAPPISSLAALFFIGTDESWLGLYLKRKALEEKVKIEKLRG